MHNCARTLVTVAGDERAHGQVWFAPTNPALTVRQMVTRFAEVNDRARAEADVHAVPGDVDEATDVLGLKPITLEVALRDAAARLRA